MNNFDKQYKQLLKKVINEGFVKPTRSGIPAYSIMGATLSHDMSEGFPLLTLRKMPQQSMRVETNFYLQGRTDKQWLIDRDCHFWDHWHNKKSKDSNDLGPTYGFEWRHFGVKYHGIDNYQGQGIDQIKWVLNKLKKYPENKRLVVTQWNPQDIDQQAIPPCPFAFQLLKEGSRLNIIFYQRSADLCIGFPNDFSQHALLLHLFCKETGYTAGKVIGMFGQVELYQNHLSGAQELLKRHSRPLPQIVTNKFTNIFKWSYKDTNFINYQHGEKIIFPIAI